MVSGLSDALAQIPLDAAPPAAPSAPDLRQGVASVASRLASSVPLPARDCSAGEFRRFALGFSGHRADISPRMFGRANLRYHADTSRALFGAHVPGLYLWLPEDSRTAEAWIEDEVRGFCTGHGHFFPGMPDEDSAARVAVGELRRARLVMLFGLGAEPDGYPPRFFAPDAVLGALAPVSGSAQAARLERHALGSRRRQFDWYYANRP